MDFFVKTINCKADYNYFVSKRMVISRDIFGFHEKYYFRRNRTSKKYFIFNICELFFYTKYIPEQPARIYLK